MIDLMRHVTINNVGGAAIVKFGPSLFISPKTASKSYHGSGSANTGGQVNTFTFFSSSFTIQSDLVDQPVALDN